jgi:hypothetical protein
MWRMSRVALKDRTIWKPSIVAAFPRVSAQKLDSPALFTNREQPRSDGHARPPYAICFLNHQDHARRPAERGRLNHSLKPGALFFNEAASTDWHNVLGLTQQTGGAEVIRNLTASASVLRRRRIAD